MKNVKITFTYNGVNETIDCKDDELMCSIYKRYTAKIKGDIKKLYFLYNGDMINQEEKLTNIIRDQNMINMLVFNLENDEENEGEVVLKQSKHIICPICSEICLISLNDYKITFSDCKNGHKFTNTMIDEFLDFQKIDESKIICDKCEEGNKNKKSEVNDNIFFKCCTCNINLCPLCKSKHSKKEESKNHLIINYDNKNYFCNKHGERYISHCKDCYRDLCDICRYDDEHFLQIIKIFIYMNLLKKKRIK